MKTSKSRLLALCLLASALLCACAEDGQNTDVTQTVGTTAPAETETEALYTLPTADYGGEACNFYVSEYYAKSLSFEEIGEPLNDAQYKMTRAAEEALNVTISETEIDLWQQLEAVRQLVMSGDTTFDVISMHERFAPQCAMEGLVMDISGIESMALDQPWWGGDILDTLALNDRLFFGVGSVNLASYQRVSCLLMNTNLASALDIEIPYEDVFAGTWTWDDVLQYHSVVTQDLNGDGNFTLDDRYNLAIGDMRIATNINYISMGANILSKGSDGGLALTMFDDQRLVDAFAKSDEILFSGNNNVKQFLTVDSYSMEGNFKAGNSLFYQIFFLRLNALRDMEDDYAILPMPKYDEAQENYLSRTDDTIFQMIPTTQDNPELSGIVLDTLSRIGHYDVLPVYIDTVVKEKMARDEMSKRSLQICFDTRALDLANTYLYSIVGSDTIFAQLMNSASFNVVSFLETKSKQMERELEKQMEAYQSID